MAAPLMDGTPASTLALAQELAPMIHAAADQIERERQLPAAPVLPRTDYCPTMSFRSPAT